MDAEGKPETLFSNLSLSLLFKTRQTGDY